MKNVIFWDVTTCGSCMNRRFSVSYRLLHQGKTYRRARNNVSSNCTPKHAAKKHYYIVFLHSMLWLLVTANVVPSSSIHATLMVEEVRSSESAQLPRRRQSSLSAILLPSSPPIHINRSARLRTYGII
jgi:hypothetical protein